MDLANCTRMLALAPNGSGIAEGGKQKAQIPQYVSRRFWQYHVSGSCRIINDKTKIE